MVEVHDDHGLQLLRLALARGDAPPSRLEPAARTALATDARRARALERRALASDPDSAEIPADAIDARLATLANAFGSELEQELAAVGLDCAGLRAALARELRFDAIARRIDAQVAPVTTAEVDAIYRRDPARFRLPERRSARQILITINPDFAENRRPQAWQRICALHARLEPAPERFAGLAASFSECPSALDGGLLGSVARGRLFPALDAALFALPAGGVSAPLESPLGFHLLRCDAIEPERPLTPAQAAAAIRERLQEGRRREARRRWLDGLAG